jgi:glycosyltransferase involved in cell wall biosynthesis
LVLDPRFGPDRWVDGQHMVIDLWNADLRRRGYEVDVVSSAHRGRARAGAPSLASVAKCADELVARTRHAPHRLAIAHGFESGEAARRLSQRGCRVVSVVHYSVAQAFDSELRRRAPVAMRGPLPLGLVRVASALARAGPRMPAALRMLESERALLEAGARTLAVGTGFRDWLRDFYPGSAERIFAVPLAARAWSETEREWPLPDSDRMRIISVGRAAPQKGWDFAADALAALEARRPELADRLEFVAVGPVPESSFGREVVARFKRLRRVRWTLLGAQPWEAVPVRALRPRHRRGDPGGLRDRRERRARGGGPNGGPRGHPPAAPRRPGLVSPAARGGHPELPRPAPRGSAIASSSTRRTRNSD